MIMTTYDMVQQQPWPAVRNWVHRWEDERGLFGEEINFSTIRRLKKSFHPRPFRSAVLWTIPQLFFSSCPSSLDYLSHIIAVYVTSFVYEHHIGSTHTVHIWREATQNGDENGLSITTYHLIDVGDSLDVLYGPHHLLPQHKSRQDMQLWEGGRW